MTAAVDFNPRKELFDMYCATDIGNKAVQYDASHPHIWKLFQQYARSAMERGHKTFSAKTIFERIRWEVTIEQKSSDGFKLNNNYTAYYARKLMAEFKEFIGFFELREAING